MNPRVKALVAAICALVVHLAVAGVGCAALLSRESQSWQIIFVVIPSIMDIVSLVIFSSANITQAIASHLKLSSSLYFILQLSSHIPLLLAVIAEFRAHAGCVGDSCYITTFINNVLAFAWSMSAILALTLGIVGIYALKAETEASFHPI